MIQKSFSLDADGVPVCGRMSADGAATFRRNDVVCSVTEIGLD